MSQDKQPHSTHQADSIMLTLVLILAVLGLLILFTTLPIILRNNFLPQLSALVPCIWFLP